MGSFILEGSYLNGDKYHEKFKTRQELKDNLVAIKQLATPENIKIWGEDGTIDPKTIKQKYREE